MALTQASEEGLKISNAGTNGQFLQKQSGNTGGLTWADVDLTNFAHDITFDNSTNAGNDIVWDESDNALEFSDHVKAKFGEDLIIGHDLPNATDLSLISSTSDLHVSCNKTIFKDTNADPSLTLDCANDKIIIADHLEPEADSTHDLGTNSVRFRNAYVDTFYGDGSNLTGLQAGATGGNSGANAVFWENQQTVTHDYTITNERNAGTWGPVTINSGVTVTVGDGEYWTII